MRVLRKTIVCVIFLLLFIRCINNIGIVLGTNVSDIDWDNSTVVIQNMEVDDEGQGLYYFEGVNMVINNSILNTDCICVYNKSHIIIMNSIIILKDGILLNDSHIEIINSTIIDSNIGFVADGVRLIYGSNGLFYNSIIPMISVQSDSKASLHNTSTIISLVFNEDSDITIKKLKNGLYDNWNLKKDQQLVNVECELSIMDSNILGWMISFDTANNASAKIHDSNLLIFSTHSFSPSEGTINATITNTTIQRLTCGISSIVNIEGCNIDSFQSRDNAKISVLNSNIYNQLKVFKNVELTLRECHMDEIWADGKPKITIIDSSLRLINGHGDAKFYCSNVKVSRIQTSHRSEVINQGMGVYPPGLIQTILKLTIIIIGVVIIYLKGKNSDKVKSKLMN